MYDKSKVYGIRRDQRVWENNLLNQVISIYPEHRSRFVTGSDSPVQRLYTPSQTAGFDYLTSLGFPGDYPFTRGVHPTMYRGKYWTMRQYAGFGSAEETNQRFKYLLAQGQTGLSVAFDLCTQIGYDSDDPMSEGEVGKVGVAIDSLADMEVLFDGIPLDAVSTSMTINAPAAVLLAMYLMVAEKQGASMEKLSGTVQNDILKEYLARGTYIFPPKQSMRLVTDIFKYCSETLPRWNSISISGYHIREAGATAAQEIGFTLADGIAYVEAAIEAGLKVDYFASRLSFFFNAHNDLLEEIAKFRAARRLWARIMKHRFGAKNPRSMMLRFHTQTAGSTLTAQQPENNIVRVAIQTLAAVLGGTQSLHTNSYDEALALPSEESARIALRTQQIVAHESGVTETIDPLAGSFYIEALTNRLDSEATEYIEKIDRLGGMVAAIEKGYPQKEIQDSAYQYQCAVEKGERVIVGVNRHHSDEQSHKDLHEVDHKIQRRQIAQLNEVKANRDEGLVSSRLRRVRHAAAGEENIMPPILDAVKAYATIGEICAVLRREFGEYRESVVL